MKKILSIALLLPIMALAQVPNTFTAGTPAKASEVNENFEYLNNLIDGATETIIDLTAEILDLPKNISTEVQCDYTYNLNGISYDAKLAIENEEVDILGTNYSLQSIDFSINGTNYKLTYPLIGSGSVSLVLNQSKSLDLCSNLLIGEYPAVFSFFEYSYITNRMSKTPYHLISPFNILIDGYMLVLGDDSSGNSQFGYKATPYYKEGYSSLPDNINNSEDFTKFVDDWIDYVSIEKVQ